MPPTTSCAPLLLHAIALHAKFDHLAVPIAGFSPAAGTTAHADCQRLCVEHSHCAGWTFREGKCWLVSAVGAQNKRAPGFVSGTVCRNETTPPATTCAVSKLAARRGESPSVALACARGSVVTRTLFASYGRPVGLCLPDGRTPAGMRELSQSPRCHAQESTEIVDAACLNRRSCTISLANATAMRDPCPGKVKRLSVRVACAPPPGGALDLDVEADEADAGAAVSVVDAGAASRRGAGRRGAGRRGRRSRRGGAHARGERAANSSSSAASIITTAAASGNGPSTWQQSCASRPPLRGDSKVRGCQPFCAPRHAKRHCCFCKCRACGWCAAMLADEPADALAQCAHKPPAPADGGGNLTIGADDADEGDAPRRHGRKKHDKKRPRRGMAKSTRRRVVKWKQKPNPPPAVSPPPVGPPPPPPRGTLLASPAEWSEWSWVPGVLLDLAPEEVLERAWSVARLVLAVLVALAIALRICCYLAAGRRAGPPSLYRRVEF